ncbi:MAG: Serine phosphatase RsbU, regulator of sigma subunit [Candidatus Ozemobacter sibiricus]|uniref:Serine phosphatase RsbU, regulator of sigma subunit n=1 Tax=Candidatus Ozemobacter sibiricus TaxID=2268124 RepID=A0A367ZR92_9BACT|nr:MAG: Serine phosphatase RsbU, regulator of sigma subunit [Candidatus Ozemobacter sibiricus]
MLLRGLGFIGLPLILAWGFWGWFAADQAREEVAQRRQDMRDLLNRVAAMGNLQQRLEEKIGRLARVGLPSRVRAARAARLERSEGGALELFLFDDHGRLVPLPGRPSRPRRVAERFLALVREAARSGAASSTAGAGLAKAFCGNADGAVLLGQSPGVLLDLLNGEQRTYGGWWPLAPPPTRSVRSPRLARSEAPAGFLVALVHRGAVSREALMDRAVGEVGRLVADRYLIGWIHPAAPACLRPPGRSWPPGVAAAVAAALPGRADFQAEGGAGVFVTTLEGEILWALEQRAPAPLPWLPAVFALAGVLGLLVFCRLAGGFGGAVFGVRGKLVWLMAVAGGTSLSVLVLTSLIDRRDREVNALERVQREDLRILSKIDRGFLVWVRQNLRAYEDLERRLRRAPAALVASAAEGLFRPRLRRGTMALQEYLVIDHRNRLLARGAAWASARRKPPRFIQELARQSLHNLRKGPLREAGLVHLIEEPGENSAGGRWNLGRGVTLMEVLGQPIIFFLGVGGGRLPHSLFMAVHDGRRAQRRYLREQVRHWRRTASTSLRFFALPGSADRAATAIPPLPPGVIEPLARLRDLALSTGLPQHRRLTLGGQDWLITGATGVHLTTSVLFVARPAAEFDALIRRLDQRLALLAGGLLLLGVGAALLAGRALLRPLQTLQAGLAAMARQDFRVRLPVQTGGTFELQRLQERFNQVMADLEDLQIARTVQEGLSPSAPLSGSGWRLAGQCVVAARLGGDFYDWFLDAAGNVWLAIGDVAGHGVPAALVAATAKAELAMHARPGCRPAEVLQVMHRGFLRNAGRFRPMTFWLGCLDPQNRLLEFAAAGHPYPIWQPSAGAACDIGQPSIPLGATTRPRFHGGTLDLSVGGRLVLYSDGLVEVPGLQGEMLGYQRFRQLLEGGTGLALAEFLTMVFDRAAAWSGSAVPADDQTLVVLEVDPSVSPPPSGRKTTSGGPVAAPALAAKPSGKEGTV